MHDVLLKIGATEYCRVWKNHTGAAVPVGIIRMLAHKHNGLIPAGEILKYMIHYGLKGSADINGILLGGQSLWLECKTGSGKQTKEQISFEKMINKFGGVYKVVKTSDEALELVQHG